MLDTSQYTHTTIQVFSLLKFPKSIQQLSEELNLSSRKIRNSLFTLESDNLIRKLNSNSETLYEALTDPTSYPQEVPEEILEEKSLQIDRKNFPPDAEKESSPDINELDDTPLDLDFLPIQSDTQDLIKLLEKEVQIEREHPEYNLSKYASKLKTATKGVGKSKAILTDKQRYLRHLMSAKERYLFELKYSSKDSELYDRESVYYNEELDK